MHKSHNTLLTSSESKKHYKIQRSSTGVEHLPRMYKTLGSIQRERERKPRKQIAKKLERRK
jgi:uncharacterized membrane protein YgaE (UPF0421/DUF939 family)